MYGYFVYSSLQGLMAMFSSEHDAYECAFDYRKQAILSGNTYEVFNIRKEKRY